MNRLPTGLVALLLLLPLIGAAQVLPAPAAGTEDLVLPDTAFIGLVRIGGCDSIVIPLLNIGADSLTIDTLGLLFDTKGVTFSSTARSIIGIAPGKRDSITILYCPEDTGCFSNELFLRVVSPADGDREQRTIPFGGCAGAPILSPDRREVRFRAGAPMECARESFIIANDGAFPLHISRIDIDNSSFALVPPETSQGLVLSPGERRELTAEFCPDSYGETRGSVSFISDTYGAAPTLQLVGTLVADSIEAVDTIDFGTVLIGLRHDTAISLFNGGTTSRRLIGAATGGTGGEEVFLLSPMIPPSQPIVIQAGSDAELKLTYLPGSVGRSQDLLRLEFDDGVRREIRLVGDAVRPAVWLDSGGAVVGSRVTLTLRTAPEIESPPAIGAFTMRFRVPPQALYPIQAFMRPGSPIPIRYDRDGTLTISGDAGTAAPSQGRIVAIEFRGLSTGEPINHVVIDSLSLFGLDTVEHNGGGTVYLEGCDVERGGTAVKIVIGSVVTGDDVISVTYSAPSGSRPGLTLYDMTGRTLISAEPDPVDDPVRHALLPTGDLRRGIYLLELRWGTERAVELIPISR